MDDLFNFVKQNSLGDTTETLPNIFSYLEKIEVGDDFQQEGYIKTGIKKFDSVLKGGGFRQGRLNCIEIVDFLFAGVFFDFVKTLANNGKKIVLNIAPSNTTRFANDYCNTTLHFSDSIENPELLKINSKGLGDFENILKEAENEKCDFLFLLYPYFEIDSARADFIKTTADKIKGHKICVFLANPLPLPTWVQVSNKGRKDRSINRLFSTGMLLPSAPTLGLHCDAKMLIRLAATHSFGNQASNGKYKDSLDFYKKSKVSFSKNPAARFELEFYINQNSILRFKESFLLQAAYSKAEGLTIDSPPPPR